MPVLVCVCEMGIHACVCARTCLRLRVAVNHGSRDLESSNFSVLKVTQTGKHKQNHFACLYLVVSTRILKAMHMSNVLMGPLLLMSVFVPCPNPIPSESKFRAEGEKEDPH